MQLFANISPKNAYVKCRGHKTQTMYLLSLEKGLFSLNVFVLYENTLMNFQISDFYSISNIKDGGDRGGIMSTRVLRVGEQFLRWFSSRKQSNAE